MLSRSKSFAHVVEVNPPPLPTMEHVRLEGAWDRVLVTDNVFGKITVSPYAYAARLTHDVPTVKPTVVVSTRDRNILAIESEVRGALGNGVDSFLVVVGDTAPSIDHQSNHFEIVEHLRDLQGHMPAFEVGMPTRFRRWQMDRRIDLGAQFFVTGPVMDPDTVEPETERLDLRDDDPPVFLMVVPPFSIPWIDRAEGFGTVAASARLRERVESADAPARRGVAWDAVAEIARRAEDAGLAGIVLTGLKFETAVSEASSEWRRRDRTSSEVA